MCTMRNAAVLSILFVVPLLAVAVIGEARPQSFEVQPKAFYI